MRLQSDKPNNDCLGVVWSLSYAYHDAPPYYYFVRSSVSRVP